MFQLSKELQTLIYSYDSTYKNLFLECLAEFHHKMIIYENYHTAYHMAYYSLFSCKEVKLDAFNKLKQIKKNKMNLKTYHNVYMIKLKEAREEENFYLND